MTVYDITFKGDIWDIEITDYENYFIDITPFQDCSDIHLYQTGQAHVIVNKYNELIIEEFVGYFEFVYKEQSLGIWEIPEEYNIFRQACLGLAKIYKYFRKQKLNNKPYKLITTGADLADW